MKRVTGLGGVFFKCEDADQQREWYRDHLGIDVQDWGGTMFQWRDDDAPERRGYTVWSPFKKDTTYFDPSASQLMVNYRVDDIEALFAAFREEGVTIAGEIEQHENGKFGWVLDPEGNKIELWEPMPHDKDPYLAS